MQNKWESAMMQCIKSTQTTVTAEERKTIEKRIFYERTDKTPKLPIRPGVKHSPIDFEFGEEFVRTDLSQQTINNFMKPLTIAFPKHAPMVPNIPASPTEINDKSVVLFALAQSTKSGKSYWIHQQSKRIWMLLMDLGHHGNAEAPNSIFMSEIIKTCKN